MEGIQLLHRIAIALMVYGTCGDACHEAPIPFSQYYLWQFALQHKL
ncbi:MAG: hypothetical protein RLZ12_285, partial [Bacillota bacterium]